MPAFSIDVRSNISLLADRLEGYRTQKLPFATVYALTKTAQEIKAAEYEAMKSAFDRPTPFTLNSLAVQAATKQLPIATVQFKEGFGSVPAWRYLGAEIESGDRVKKSFERALERAGILKADEFAVPTGAAPRDAYGNVPGSEIVRMLSQLSANIPGANATGSKRSKTARRTGAYFVLRDKTPPDGIYMRKGGGLLPIFLFVGQPRYQARLPFRQTAEQIFNQRFDANFQAAMLRYASPPVPRAA